VAIRKLSRSKHFGVIFRIGTGNALLASDASGLMPNPPTHSSTCGTWLYSPLPVNLNSGSLPHAEIGVKFTNRRLYIHMKRKSACY